MKEKKKLVKKYLLTKKETNRFLKIAYIDFKKMAIKRKQIYNQKNPWSLNKLYRYNHIDAVMDVLLSASKSYLETEETKKMPFMERVQKFKNYAFGILQKRFITAEKYNNKEIFFHNLDFFDYLKNKK